MYRDYYVCVQAGKRVKDAKLVLRHEFSSKAEQAAYEAKVRRTLECHFSASAEDLKKAKESRQMFSSFSSAQPVPFGSRTVVGKLQFLEDYEKLLSAKLASLPPEPGAGKFEVLKRHGPVPMLAALPPVQISVVASEAPAPPKKRERKAQLKQAPVARKAGGSSGTPVVHVAELPEDARYDISSSPSSISVSASAEAE